MHTASPTLAISSGASSPVSGGCALTNPRLGTQWSLGPSSSWAFLSPSSLTSSSPTPSPIMPTTWWYSSPLPMPLTSPTSVSSHLRPSLLSTPLPLYQ
ncbi:hypothetical protein B296_00014329 [Ensete ventricosum]|uniref:Uncharacterized protein n=1 Tax=Ensete ventricosum TaxID=4639 RepID=A0A427B609_ENSVE|nr:hypothetical protein B296_00014329 [Ensete ventricosum]